MRRPRGFTLVELLVVIAIIGVLVALLLPAVQAAREAARRHAQCTNNLKQLAFSCHNYLDSKKAFPIGGNASNQLSWLCYILPFIEEQSIYDQLQLNGSFKKGSLAQGNFSGGPAGNNWGSAKANLIAYQYHPTTFYCPSAVEREMWSEKGSSTIDNGTHFCYSRHYLGVAGPIGLNTASGTPGTPYAFIPFSAGRERATDGMLIFDTAIKPKQVTDGLSKTLLLGEASNLELVYSPSWGYGDAWTAGFIQNYFMPATKNVELAMNSIGFTSNNIPFCSYHAGGAFFATADGAIAFLSENIDMTLYRSLASRNGNENASMP